LLEQFAGCAASQNQPIMTDKNQTIDVEDVTLPTKRTEGETIEERLTGNAYHNILPARYLRKDSEGNPVESQEDLFRRVAQNVGLAEVVFEAENLGVDVKVTPDQIKPQHPRRNELAEEVFGEGVEVSDDEETTLTEENVTKFAYETVVPELENEELREHVDSIVDQFQDQMEMLGFMPNSPTLMNAGDELQQLSACFVDSPEDDISKIHETAKEAAEVFQSGGGMGYAFWKLRPYGDSVGSTGGIASGPITFMRTFDQLCETIAQGGARRGAQMAVMRVSHPGVIEFIHSKNKDVSLAHTLRLNDPDDYTYNTFGEALEEARGLIDDEGRVPKHLRNAVEGHLSNFNISVGVTNDFMEAARNGEDHTFINPNTGEPHIASEKTKEMYERYGLGEYVEVGEELTIPAQIIKDRMVKGAHENGEPGVIYLDRVNEEHSFPVESTPTAESSKYEMLATNPCGEQPLMEYEACNLGHINLSTIVRQDADIQDFREYVESAETDDLEELVDGFLSQVIEWDDFNERIEMGTRFLENVVTMSDFPVKKIEETVRDNRKIGLGIMGLAQLYVQVGVPYGSEEGNEIARQIMRHINHNSKKKSHELAKQRGSFNNWEDSKYESPTEYKEWFEKQTGLKAEDWEDGYAMRNHNTTTIAPTGTTSMVGNTTGGCEPIYNVAYYKNVSDDVQGDEMLVEFDDYFLRVLEANDIDVDAVKKEAQEQMSKNEFDGVEGLSTVPTAIGELFVVTSGVSPKEHAAVQCACQEGVDSAISKTCNFPNSATRDDMEEVYDYIYDNGGKGVTVYRDGTRSKQVLTTRAQNAEFSDEGEAAEQLIEQINEVFGGIDGFFENEEVQNVISDTYSSLLANIDGETNHESTGTYAKKRPRKDALYGVTQRIDTGYGRVYVNINKDEDGRPFELFANIGNSGGFTASFTEALAKTISTALRSGVDPEEIVNELNGIRSPKVAWDKGEQIQSIPDAIGTALSRVINGEVEPESGNFPTPSTTEKGSESTSISQSQTSELSGTETDSKTDTQKIIAQGASPECPECSEMSLYFSEGCKTCESCGWSEC